MALNLTTLVFELLNFLVLLWVLHRLVYRPLQRAIDARTREMSDARAKVSEQQERFEGLSASLEEEKRQLLTLRARARQEAMEEAVEERARLLTQAREDAASERARVTALLATERTAAEAWVRKVAVERGTQVAGRLLERLAPDAVEKALEGGLVEAVGRHAEELQRAWSRVGSAAPEAELVALRLPAESLIARIRGALESALGARPRLSVREDESLGAGLVLRLGDQTLDASLSGQLSAFRALALELSEEQADG